MSRFEILRRATEIYFSAFALQNFVEGITSMTIELSEDDLKEIVRSLETVRFLHAERGLSVENLTKVINQLRMNLPGSGIRIIPKSNPNDNKELHS